MKLKPVGKKKCKIEEIIKDVKGNKSNGVKIN